MLSPIELICAGQHGDPFAILGPHLLTQVVQVDSAPAELALDALAFDASAQVFVIRAFIPSATRVIVVDSASGDELAVMSQLHPEGFYEAQARLAQPPRYQLKVEFISGIVQVIDDPYRFGLMLSANDIWLLAEGTHLAAYEILGAHPRIVDGVQGICFAVWAPNAKRASIVGDFNYWDGRKHPMRLRRECGTWELFVPGLAIGERYKFELIASDGRLLPARADPYARLSELRPATASIVTAALPLHRQSDQSKRNRAQANSLGSAMSIYEVHLSSWRKAWDEKTGLHRWLSWPELTQTLIPYVVELGFTHLELLPISEHPFDGSWGYQPIGLFSPTARFGRPEEFALFVSACHAAGVGVIVDWVPAHFPTDAHGLSNFDGTHLYEYADPKEGFHRDWNTLIYNVGRREVVNFLICNALYWIEVFGVDGLRVDAVSSMLYRDYSREPGQWIPNIHGGRENLESIDFLKRLNEAIGSRAPHAFVMAEESTAYPAVSRPTYAGGLGFHLKWNMGWMHDSLQYMARDPIYRKSHHGEITFSLMYAFTENFVLPISHDEVVHGKGSLLAKMPGDPWQKFANLRAFLGFMFAHPGKKLLFMGCEFAQEREWNHDQSLDWHLLEQAPHGGVQSLVRDLNNTYRATPALYDQDFDAAGFEWIDHGDAHASVLSFIRKSRNSDSLVLVVCNFTPVIRDGLRIGVPLPGQYRDCLNTDAQHYGGSNVGTPLGIASSQAVPWHHRDQSIVITLGPLSTVIFKWEP